MQLKTPHAVMDFIKSQDVKMIALRFMDFPGLWQHFGVPAKAFPGDEFEEGLGFDGSSSRGWKAINESDMLIIPLALMDGYLFSISKNLKDAWKKCRKLIDEAEKKSAVMVVLWHQRVFNEKEFPGYKNLYERLIIECKRRNAEFLLCRDFLDKLSNRY